MWRLIPWVLRFTWAAFKMIAVSLIAVFKGWPPTAKEMADEWTSRVMEKKILPQDKDFIVWHVFYYVAFAVLIVGWIMASFLTVWLVRLLT
jgi:hypothetical protein